MADDRTPVTHEGVITAIGESSIIVEILNKSACAACHAKGVCSASDEKVKEVEVPLTIGNMSAHFAVGDKVLVILSSSLTFKAVLYAYGVPLVLLLLALVIASALNLPELYVGLSGIGIVIFYYIALAFFKNKLAREFRFSIRKI
ncbi:MAG: SoxR reducing system RseC family protein [Bacteroidales bacterium]|nr:SoxR reducing system RseC family protein [Bacteroidales bacterium]MBR5056647.1 SoxR reducing system RseC family protein [Bacteroidales bacterium]